MTASRNYSSTAGKMTLVGTITGAATSIVVDVTTGLPSVPYTLLLDPGLSVEEVVEVTAVGGTTLTVTRGVDGTSAQTHTNGAELRHAYSARDFQDSRNHEGNVVAHGATGAVVGTTNTQALTNKTIDGSLNTFSNIPATAVTGSTAQVTLSGQATVTAAGGGVAVSYGHTFATAPSPIVCNVYPYSPTPVMAVVTYGSATGFMVVFMNTTNGAVVTTGTYAINWIASGV